MWKKITLGLLLAFTVHALFAVEIDTSLLDEAKKVRYIEDKSPVSWRHYNTGKQIRDMGRFLGKGIRYQEQTQKDPEPYVSGAPSYKYSAMRVYSSDDMAGADILYIGKTADVTTTKCLFRIVSGYIEKAYDIPMEQADTIAEKVCWWNNNHYGEKDYFTAHFNPKVLDAFGDRTTVIGLAASYKYWTGKTRIVIPFVFVKKEAPAVTEPAPAVEKNMPMPETPAKTQQTEQPVKGNMPANYRILFGILIAAAVLLIILLIKVILGIHKNNR